MTVLVIDIGSSSVRALLFDQNATLIPAATAKRAHNFNTQPPGAATADPEQLRGLVEACIDEILPAIDDVRVVGMATFVGNVLGVDEHNRALTPIYTYADTRSAPDVDSLREKIDTGAFHQRTGCIHHTAYQPGRLHWLRRTKPERFGKVHQWIDFGTYLYRYWFGGSPCSYSVAAWTGLLHREQLDWDAEWLRVLGIPAENLPQLADYNSIRRGLQADYAKRWPKLQAVPFTLAVGDGAAANIGSGAVERDTMALTVGTTAALRVVSSETLPPVPDGLWSYRVDAAHHLTGGATSEGGNIFQWARETLALPEDIESALAARQPNQHGLGFLPFFAGERSPGWSLDATGAITGLRLSTEPLDILQAALEGVALRLATIAEQLTGDETIKIMASGGALVGSPAWTQIIADAIDQPLYVLDEPETTARGVAILALHALDDTPLNSFPPEVGVIVEPRPAHAITLRQAREEQARLYDVLVRR